jgi:CheY-like chemotaxis protein
MSSRILVAEDNRANSILIRTYLSKFGYACDVVADGIEAVAAAEAGRHELVLMDIRMPRMDGLEATRRIRALGGRLAALPILALTANTRPDDRAAYFAAGMNDVVTKPIDAADLYARILERLRDAA